MACCCISLRIGALIASTGKVVFLLLAFISKLYKESASRVRLIQATRRSLRDSGIELTLHVINIIFGLLLVNGVRKERWCPINASFLYSTAIIILLYGATTLENRLGIKSSIDTTACEFLAFLLGIYFIYGGYCASEELKSGFMRH
ncbi:hypothetical protein Ocin01_10329 [Orchesella cincta]|uniref:Uncharacterized protein n=1 Tax=Orchesella cincta TaxID=48709 RepID=A0A1D2MTC4_ORCCI|nr:hypothetical protein Ocin01_10329 [Orchesella cincta]